MNEFMISSSNLIFMPVLLPLIGAAAAFFAKAFCRGKLAKIIEYSGAAVGLLLPWLLLFNILPELLNGVIYQGAAGGWEEGIGISYRFDGLAWLVNFLGFTVAMAAWIYSLGAGPKGAKFTAIFLIQTAALAATAMTADIFNLFVCLEVLGIASYVLVASSEKPGAFLASFSYLMVSATAMIFFLAGIYGLYRLTGALSYADIAESLQQSGDGGSMTAIISIALIISAVALRVAVMPLYGWLPDAHAMAPHAISAVLSGVLIKTPLFALSRILVIIPSGSNAGQLLGLAGGITALASVIIALSQKDAKKLLAYHSISQIGYIVCAWGAAMHIGINTAPGLILMSAAYLHALYHALFKGTLFLTVGTLTDRAGERNVYKLRNGAAILQRAGERIPVTFISFMLAAMAISALPPLNGFASKTALSYALKGRWEYIVLTLASAGTAASFIKLSLIFFPAGKKNLNTTPVPESPPKVHRSMKSAELFLAGLCLAGGLFSPWISKTVGVLLRPAGYTGLVSAIPPGLYSSSNLQKTLIITISGAALFLICMTKPGKAVLRRIRERPRSFHGLFVSFALGAACMAAWMIYKTL